MQLTDTQVKRFQSLYEKLFGIVIDSEEAEAKGLKLAHLAEVILKDHFRKNNSKLNE